jgi:hypothetical protein
MIRRANPPGHFCLFKNNDKINNAYMNINNEWIDLLVNRSIEGLSRNKTGLGKSRIPIKDLMGPDVYIPIEDQLRKIKTYSDAMSCGFYFNADETLNLKGLISDKNIHYMIPRNELGKIYSNYNKVLHRFNDLNYPFKWNNGELFTSDYTAMDLLHFPAWKSDPSLFKTFITFDSINHH